MVVRRHVPRGTAQRDVALVVDRARPREEFPVARAGREVEGAGVHQGESAFARGDEGELREADVVADGDADFAVARDFGEGDLVAWRQHFGLVKGDFAWDVDVEEVHFAVAREQRAVLAEGQASVVPFVLLLGELWDAAADQGDLTFLRYSAEDVVARALLLTGRSAGGRTAADIKRRELLGVFGEILCAIGRVEAFWEDDEFGACAGGFEDFGAGGGEVGGFVGAGGQLDEGELEGFGEEFGGHCCEECLDLCSREDARETMEGKAISKSGGMSTYDDDLIPTSASDAKPCCRTKSRETGRVDESGEPFQSHGKDYRI